MISPMRRVTIPTADIEKSIDFYQDVFGMKVFYDQVMVSESDSLLGPEGIGRHRLVSLQQGDGVVGMVGLMEYIEPKLDIKPFRKPAGGTYPVIFVFMVDNMEAVTQKLRSHGCEIVGGPLTYEIPARGSAVGVTALDPNGVLLDLTQLPSHDPAQPGPISAIRRVTIPVARDKMEQTIKFYEEVLGLKVFYDQSITVQGNSLLGIPGIVTTRVVSLQQPGSNFGMVGLMEYREPAVDVRPFVKRAGYPYEVIFVFTAEGMDDIIARATALGGTLAGRKRYEIPQRGMADGAMIADPNGVMVELTEWLNK